MKAGCTVKDFMSVNVLTFKPDMEIMEALRILVEKGISGGPVVNNQGSIVGMLTEKDCVKISLNAGYYGDWGGRVENFMHPHVVTIEASLSIFDVAEKFISGPYRRYPVVQGNRLIGQISRHDVLKAILALSTGNF